MDRSPSRGTRRRSTIARLAPPESSTLGSVGAVDDDAPIRRGLAGLRSVTALTNLRAWWLQHSSRPDYNGLVLPGPCNETLSGVHVFSERAGQLVCRCGTPATPAEREALEIAKRAQELEERQLRAQRIRRGI